MKYNLEPLVTFKRHAFYVFTNPLEMPLIRNELLTNKLIIHGLKIKPSDLDEFLNHALELMAKGDTKGCFEILAALKRFRQLEDHSDLLLDVVLSVVLIDDEPPGVILDKYTKQKRELIKNNPELHGFFLTIGSGILAKMSTGQTTTEGVDSLDRPQPPSQSD